MRVQIPYYMQYLVPEYVVNMIVCALWEIIFIFRKQIFQLENDKMKVKLA